MKKILIFIPLLFLTCATASAETIYTHSAEEYAAVMYDLRHQTPMSIMSDIPENTIEDRVLLLRNDTDIDVCGAQYDICDEYAIHTLIYSTAGEADAAYEYYLENGYSVCRNEKLTITEVTPSQIHAPYLSWGVRYIGSDRFMDGLIKDYGSVRNMPDVTVAVIDSGIDYTHPRLKGRIDTYNDYDCYNNDNDAMDDNHHGTHVAGIITDNTLENVKLIPIKITDDDGNTDTNYMKEGLKKALELDIDIINISIASPTMLNESAISGLKSTFDPLFDAAHRRGITICISAGNGAHNANYIFPAFMENTIIVSNCQSDGTIYSGSNYGSVVDLAAPGTDIYSTYPVSKGSYKSLTGTSMAAPFVSAAAALLKTMDSDITPPMIERVLKENVNPILKSGSRYYGNGILYIGDIYESSDDPIYDAITGEFSGANILLTIDNSKKLLKNGAYIILKGTAGGRITRLQIQRVPASTEENVSVAFYGYGGKDNFGTVTAYLWQSITDQKPLSNAYNIPKK